MVRLALHRWVGSSGPGARCACAWVDETVLRLARHVWGGVDRGSPTGDSPVLWCSPHNRRHAEVVTRCPLLASSRDSSRNAGSTSARANWQPARLHWRDACRHTHSYHIHVSTLEVKLPIRRIPAPQATPDDSVTGAACKLFAGKGAVSRGARPATARPYHPRLGHETCVAAPRWAAPLGFMLQRAPSRRKGRWRT